MASTDDSLNPDGGTGATRPAAKLMMRLRSPWLALVVLFASRVHASPLSEGATGRGARIFTNHDRSQVVPRSHVRHEWHDEYQVDGWRRNKRADVNARLPMRIGLKQSPEVVQGGHDKLMDMYDD